MTKWKYLGLAVIGLLAILADFDQRESRVTPDEIAISREVPPLVTIQGKSCAGETCSSFKDTSASGGITITPPAGQYVYLTGVFVEKDK